jgi:hypothetical protein
MSSIIPRYSVPVFYSDCSPSELLHQCFDNLNFLDTCISDAFSRISARIAEERSKFTNLNQRVNSANSRISEIQSNSHRVTTIFSAAKFPAPDHLPSYRPVNGVIPAARDLSQLSLLDDLSDSERPFRPESKPDNEIPFSDRFAPAQPADTSKLFVSLNKLRLKRTEKASNESLEGLGTLPAYLPSISSVILFNSDANPYKQYNSINNLEGVGGQDRAIQESGPGAAPKSLIEGAILPSFSGINFEYKPILSELPTFENQLPQNLPLGKLADISFGIEAQPSIAPSLASLNLPNFELPALPAPSKVSQPSSSGSALSATAAPPPAPSSSIPPPPSAPSFTSPNAPAAPPPPVVSNSAPIAPPPPAPPAPPAPASAAPTAKPAGASGTRGALLDAIRDKDNMRRLKKTGSGEPKRKNSAPVPQASASSDSGNMMSALREAMARRHTVISGKHTIEKPLAAPNRGARVDKIRPPIDDGGDDAPEDAVLSAKLKAHSKKRAQEDEDWNV